MTLSKTTKYNHETKRCWHLIDASKRNFGRIASEVSLLLQGKNKPYFSPQQDCGDFVVLVNAKYLKVSHPAKWDKKIYYHYSGYPGGIKNVKLKDMLESDPTAILRKAVFSMLPKNKLRAERINRLKLYAEEQEGKELYESMQKKSRNV